MKSRPRQLALTVYNLGSIEEPNFVWEVLESTGAPREFPERVRFCPEKKGYGTYGEALVAGYEAWRRLIGDDMVNGPWIVADEAP